MHGRWPAGLVEKLPELGVGGESSLKGVRVVGDLTGIPLLKFSAHTGAKAVNAILKESEFAGARGQEGVLDLAIIGGGVSGLSAAIEAKKAGLNYKWYEAKRVFSTIEDFPKGKPIFTYPTGMTPAGELSFKGEVKDALLDELQAQKKERGIECDFLKVNSIRRKSGLLFLENDEGCSVKALRVIVAIGRSGNYRKLGVPGEELDKVSNRLHDPAVFKGKKVLVVGGGDSALESAVALDESGAEVSLSYRKGSFSRPKPDNVDRLRESAVEVVFESEVENIEVGSVTLKVSDARSLLLENDQVFAMTGREAPLDFFRKSGIHLLGEWRAKSWLGLIAFFGFCVGLYHWKSVGWIPLDVSGFDKKSLVGSVVRAAMDPSFYYSLAYCLCVVIFGFRRIRRRRTPYVKLQTLTLMVVQVVPLFLLPYIILPWMGSNGCFDSGFGGLFANTFFPNGEYWRTFGFILAWPLFLFNLMSEQPLWGWLILSLVQTFVIIPLLVRRWGKGAYCGWVCSCGALAETLGDAHRHKMPHGPFWNKLNMLGQVVLGVAVVLFVLRVAGWIFPQTGIGDFVTGLANGFPVFNYKYLIDLWLAGILGVGFYFHASGRVWCRFACPLAALMHIYVKFSQFRIFSDKKKCISCNVCTAVCHQGIDVMNFANKGLPMEDPECVRCSACVQNCPTGVLSFGRYNKDGNIVLDRLAAASVEVEEGAASTLMGFIKDIEAL